jgi:hypothetical protein
MRGAARYTRVRAAIARLNLMKFDGVEKLANPPVSRNGNDVPPACRSDFASSSRAEMNLKAESRVTNGAKSFGLSLTWTGVPNESRV